MLPVNQVVNSERVLKTKQYQFDSSRQVEDIWLFKYCRERLSKSWEETKDLWKPIFLSRHPDFYEEEIEAFFWVNWERSKRIRFNAEREIMFTEEEVKKIRKANIPPWLKKYALMLYGYFKALNISKVSIGKLKFHQLARGTGMKPLSDGEKPLDFIYFPLKKAKLIKLLSINTVVSITESKDNVIDFSVSTIADLPFYFWKVAETKKCSICGSEFTVNSKTKRDICLECWKKKEAERAKKYRRTRNN